MRKWVLEGLVEIATRRRKLVLISSIIITVLSLVLSFRLSIDPRWSALLPEDMAVVREFMRIDEHYLQPSNMIIAVSGDDPLVIQEICDRASAIISDRMLVKPGMNNHEILESGRLVKHVYNRQPVEWMTKHMLALVKPEDAKRLRDLYNDPSLLGFLTHLNDDFEREYGDSASVEDDERNIVRSLDALERFSHLLRKAAHERVTDDEISRTVRDITVGNPYVMSLDNSMSLVLVAPAVSTDNIEGLIAMDRAIEQHLKPLESAYPEYAIERTGIVPISRDEMESVGPYTIAISIGALVAIFLLLMYNFRSAVTPILALVPVVTGIVWSMGFIALTLGVLNLITVMIMVVLLGLGIDFTIHLASRFYGEIASGSSVESAVSNMIEGTGKGVVTGALTTATAFLVLLVADVKAVSEFGFCAGFGIIFTLLASIWILPSLLAWRESRRRGKNRTTQPISQMPFLGKIALFAAGNGYAVISIFFLIVLLGIFAGSSVQWEYNFMKLEPKGLRSVELQDEIVEKYRLSMTTSMVTVGSVEKSRAVREKLEDHNVVGEVVDISQYISRADYMDALPYVEDLRSSLAEYTGVHDYRDEEFRTRLADETDRFWANIVEMQALSFTAGLDRIVEKTEYLVNKRDTRDESLLRMVADMYLEDDVDPVMLNDFSARFSHQLHDQLTVMASVERPVTEEMMPEKTRNRFVSHSDDGYLVTILPTKNLYEKEELENFKDAVTQINPRVTGTPQLILKMNQATIRQGSVSMLLALVVIFALLYADFRKPFTAFLTTLPLVVSLAMTLGLMYLLGHKLNYINMIGLPVIIGIGVDDGVHFIHRYLERGEKNLESAANGVGRAMLLTSLTTMIGFGSLMFYLMQGMASLGFVLFFGVGFCFIVTVILLPAMVKTCDRLIKT